jgi:hypothetical protein
MEGQGTNDTKDEVTQLEEEPQAIGIEFEEKQEEKEDVKFEEPVEEKEMHRKASIGFIPAF